MHGLHDSSSPYNIFIHFRTLFCCTSFVFNTFSFPPIYREKKPLSPPIVAKGCLDKMILQSRRKGVCVGGGGGSFLEQKDWGLENIFLQSPSQNKKHFFKNQKRKLVSQQVPFPLSFIIWETPSLELGLHTFKISTMSKFQYFSTKLKKGTC